MVTGYLAKLNRDQRAAVTYGITAGSATVCGPLLVLAGPGTGKTLTLAHRAAHLILNGVNPQRILLLTFTRRAAAEMAQRVRLILRATLGRKPLDLPWSGTFHSIGAFLLREYAQKVGLKPSFTILDRPDALDLMNAVRRELGLSLKKCKFPMKGTCVSIHSLMINSDQTLERILARRFARFAGCEAQLKTLFHEYAERKQAQNVLD